MKIIYFYAIIKYMKYILISLYIYIFSTLNSISEESYISHVHAQSAIESFQFPNSEKFSIYKDQNSWTNNIGDYGVGKCMGSIHKTIEDFKLDIICEFINQDGEIMWQRAIRDGDEISGSGRVEYFAGTGKYKALIGAKCNYAVRYLDERNFSIEKCKLTDKQYNKLVR